MLRIPNGIVEYSKMGLQTAAYCYSNVQEIVCQYMLYNHNHEVHFPLYESVGQDMLGYLFQVNGNNSSVMF